MKGFSILQPWATLMAINAKLVETRSWATHYRGEVAIAASARLPWKLHRLCLVEPFASVLAAAGFADPDSLPLGTIVAVGNLDSCRPTDVVRFENALAGKACRQPYENAFGDYTDGRFGWEFTNVRALARPVPCKGALGLWTLPPEILSAVQSQLEEFAAA